MLDACRRCFASLFTDRAISYREAKGFDHLKVALAIGVQQMVRSDLAGAGVMFSIDTETGFDRVVLIDAAWGLGETVVQGTIDPDEYQVFKPLLADAALKPIVHKWCGGKALKMIYTQESEQPTRNVSTSPAERSAYVLTDAEILQLASIYGPTSRASHKALGKVARTWRQDPGSGVSHYLADKSALDEFTSSSLLDHL